MPKLLDSGLTEQQEEFVALIATKGYTIKDAALKAQVSAATGYVWDKKPEIQAAIQAVLHKNRQRIQVGASALIDKALRTLDDAMSNPGMTPTQVKAAHIVILTAQGNDSRDANVTPQINIQMNTTLSPTVVQEQHTRHKLLNTAAVDGTYTIVTPDELSPAN